MNLVDKLLGPDADLAELLRGLFERLPPEGADHGELDPEFWNRALLDPARDILGRSGKGVRAALLEHSWHLAGGSADGPPDVLPVLIELLHVGSLIIDDIEDDSETRRGGPALHRKYGVPVALNTANWMYFLSLTLLFRIRLEDPVRLALFEDVSLGLLRCHKGQALDLTVRITRVPRPQVPAVVARSTRLKTGSLMELAAVIGAHGAGAPPDRIAALAEFGAGYGVGLQMIDDWSGIRDERRKEKGIEDIRHGRPTWPWAWLAEDRDDEGYARVAERADALSTDREAEEIIATLREALAPAAPERIREHLGRAVARLHERIGDSRHLRDIREDVRKLETAYG
jgi:geranylgeranyl pyrophosphate synthase